MESNDQQTQEMAMCEASPVYFLREYGWVFNANEERWRRFDLWPAQAWVVVQLLSHRLVVILKARQLGLSWVMLGYVLWLLIFRPGSAVGIFSKTEDEAIDLLNFRLKGMYQRLPAWMQARETLEDNKSRWVLSNGSLVMAFPTTGGRSYTFGFVLVDEADFQPDLSTLITATKPTIDAGGQMVLLSTVDKSRPASRFKQIYRGAKQKINDWLPVFLPWWARPGRDSEWYAAQRRDALVTGSLDDVHQEYPATDTEALAPRTLDKRLSGEWLEECYIEIEANSLPPYTGPGAPPALTQLEIYCWPEPGRQYVIGADPAEGNPTSDDSALTVLDRETGEECAALAGKFQPAVFAAHIDTIGQFFNRAVAMVERNNHGHAVILWLQDNGKLKVVDGQDGRPGWHSTTMGKTLLYDGVADAFREQETVLHSFMTYVQLASIEGRSLRAPDGERDDRADSYALANIGREFAGRSKRKRAKVW